MTINKDYFKVRLLDLINYIFNLAIFNISVQFIYAVVTALMYQTLDPYTYMYLNNNENVIGFSYTLLSMLNCFYVLITFMLDAYIFDLKKVIKL